MIEICFHNSHGNIYLFISHIYPGPISATSSIFPGGPAHDDYVQSNNEIWGSLCVKCGLNNENVFKEKCKFSSKRIC